MGLATGAVLWSDGDREVTMGQGSKFSEDVVPLSDIKVNPGRIVSQVRQTRRPVLLTSRGRGVAVMQALSTYEAETEERAFLRAVVEGLMDLEEGREHGLAEVKKRLGLASCWIAEG